MCIIYQCVYFIYSLYLFCILYKSVFTISLKTYIYSQYIFYCVVVCGMRSFGVVEKKIITKYR